MDKIVVRGGLPLSGTIPIDGEKNAALPLMAASLLTDEPVVLANLPELADIRTMAELLSQHGVAVTPRRAGPGMPSHVLELSARNITSTTAPYDIVRKMRASFLVLGPLVARCGTARRSRRRAATRSASARSICTSRGCSGSAPKSNCRAAISRRARAPNGTQGCRNRLSQRLGRRHRACPGWPRRWPRARARTDQCRP